ncbi:hypothetical protein EV385_1274 [Krasilnikovia cinnamomea]|uniref:Uncharacterized protein n=1 Tax=Krasilnikovia cinnamomea TaxID=349313 RepID=A0A4Q7ZGN7_9ACTN|nr:hypothetical protein [Krasilnikovia cinnamomea]RZU49521.1 hypothetical protein EV385_1274 [Krasilnikovia cinnamomea]
MTRSWTTVSGFLAAVLMLPAPTPVSAAPGGPSCAWPQEVGADADNIALPDTNAHYWVTPFRVRADREITVTGTFPDARYASLTVYNGLRGTFTRDGVFSSRTDYQIAPDPGSVNPWQESARPGGSYTLYLRHQVAPGQTNTIPIAPARARDGDVGFLVYRTYLPADRPSVPARLPTLTVIDGGVPRTLKPCPATVAPAGARTPIIPPPRTAPDLAFARGRGADELFPNPDSGYLSAWIHPPRGDRVVVIRGRAASSPDTPHPSPWPAPGDDMRYWSLCTNLRRPYYPVVVNELPDGSVDPGCRHDDAAALDARGYYTFVLGTEAQRPAVQALPGATFVPFSLEHPRARHLVVLRNMLPVDSFRYSVLDAPANGRARPAAAAMGDYYPRGAVCAFAVLAAEGPAGCGLPD